jgi:hypothetical protein
MERARLTMVTARHDADPGEEVSMKRESATSNDASALPRRGFIGRLGLAGLGAAAIAGSGVGGGSAGAETPARRPRHGAALTQPDTKARKLVNANPARRKCILTNAGTVRVFLGYDKTVSVETGTPLHPGQQAIDSDSKSALWGVTEVGTGDIRVLEV